jgi:hypothetical protein
VVVSPVPAVVSNVVVGSVTVVGTVVVTGGDVGVVVGRVVVGVVVDWLTLVEGVVVLAAVVDVPDLCFVPALELEISAGALDPGLVTIHASVPPAPASRRRASANAVTRRLDQPPAG